jgi:hypothetical protein
MDTEFHGLADNVSEAILGRINNDDLRAIDDPVAAGQDAPCALIGQDSSADFSVEKNIVFHHYLL